MDKNPGGTTLSAISEALVATPVTQKNKFNRGRGRPRKIYHFVYGHSPEGDLTSVLLTLHPLTALAALRSAEADGCLDLVLE